MGVNLLAMGWNETQEIMPGDSAKLPAGAYVCKVVDARIRQGQNNNSMLVLDIDIAEGEKNNYFSTHLAFDGTWNFNAQVKRYISKSEDPSAFKRFKGFINFLVKQNPGLKINLGDFEPAELRGILCGFTFAEREYESQSGEIKTVVTVKFPCEIEKVRKGEISTPPPEKLDKKNDFSTPPLENMSDIEAPF